MLQGFNLNYRLKVENKLDDASDKTQVCTIDDSQYGSSFSSIQTKSSKGDEECSKTNNAPIVFEVQLQNKQIMGVNEESKCMPDKEGYTGGEESAKKEELDEEEEWEEYYTYVYDYDDEEDPSEDSEDDDSEEEEYEYETEDYDDDDEEEECELGEEKKEVDHDDDDDDDDDGKISKSSRSSLKKFRTNSFIERRKGKLDEYYTIDEYVAQGSFGVVCSATHIETGTVRAIKELKKSKKHHERNLHCIKEFNILKDLDHPNILRMYELFEERRHYYIVTELCNGGDLNREIRASHGPYTEKDAALLMREVLACVNYCHKNRIVHRDLKPGNILLEENKKLDQIKIIDFGEATTFDDDTRLTEIAGTIAYMAPEVLKMSYGPKCDIWSCGVITYFVLSGKQPFKGQSEGETCKNIMNGQFCFNGSIWESISSNGKDFIRKLLTWDEKSRPSAEEAMQHPWISKNTIEMELPSENRDSKKKALNNLQGFEANTRLKLATSSFIASQLLQKEEKEKIDETFRLMDTDRDGYLTKNDLKAGYSECFGVDLSDGAINDMFLRADLGHTGAIEYSEFVIATTERKKLLTAENMKKSFARFDLKRRGFLTRSDIREILDMDETATESEVNGIIDQIDADGDGKITFDEFVSDLWANQSAFLNSDLEALEEFDETPDEGIQQVEVGKERKLRRETNERLDHEEEEHVERKTDNQQKEQDESKTPGGIQTEQQQEKEEEIRNQKEVRELSQEEQEEKAEKDTRKLKMKRRRKLETEKMELEAEIKQIRSMIAEKLKLEKEIKEIKALIQAKKKNCK